MLAQEQVHRWHGEEHRDALARSAVELVERYLRIELPKDVHRAARVQHGIGVQVQPARMKKRQHVEEHVIARDLVGEHGIDGVEEHHAIGLDHALGAAGRAGGVEQVPDVVLVAAWHVDDVAGCAGQRSLEFDPTPRDVDGLPICEIQHTHGQRALQVCGHVDETVACYKHVRRAVLQDRQQLRHRQAPVQAHHHHAGFRAAVQHLEIRGAVVCQHSHPRTGRQLQLLYQYLGKPARPFVELSIGHAAASVDVHQRHLVGRVLGVLVQPIDDDHIGGSVMTRSRVCRGGSSDHAAAPPRPAESSTRSG